MQKSLLHLPVWMQLVAKAWMEVEAFPGEVKETQARILESQPIKPNQNNHCSERHKDKSFQILHAAFLSWGGGGGENDLTISTTVSVKMLKVK